VRSATTAVTALREAGLAVEPAWSSGDYTYRSGLAAAEKLLSQRRPPTAIFASNDDMGAAPWRIGAAGSATRPVGGFR
jgi:DNA-binding LacI/PurR family transcriptional regulator